MNTNDQDRQSAFQQTLLSARRTMLLSEILKLAVDSFRASKLRFALTALGMVIGTASVILVVTIGMTGKRFILDEIQKIGTNMIEVEYSGGGATGSEQVLYHDYLTREDEEAVVSEVPTVRYSSPMLEMHDRISFGGGVVKDTLVLGVSPQYRDVRNLILIAGRFFDQQDESAHIKCAVVTVPFAKEMFGSSQAAIGREFTIQGIPFTIIGTFKESVETFGQSEIADETILIPYSVARYFTGTDTVKQIFFSIRNMEDVPDASREIHRVIAARHKANSVYKVFNMTELLTTAASIANILTVVLVLVAAVTLAVGGVGIMNIMLANVRSRIREIGVRKALGATYREIKLQFLAEAVIISLTGGVAGTILGLLLPFSIRFFTNYPLPFSWWSVVIALSAATLVGIIFGTVPATRAAQLNPVESLKYE
ncbi:MAG: ABC transporter permease [Acidobacteriota bacterium]|nr:ABC transporter permease [Acidobacteriota bacterium]